MRKPVLFPYQERGVAKIDRFGMRALLADSMGLGKSIQALTAWVRYLGPNSVAVVICPASLKWNWEEEAWKHYRVRATVLSGSEPKSVSKIPRKGLFVVNPEVLIQARRRGKGWLGFLMKLKPDLIIPDECHMYGGRTKRTKALKELCSQAPYVIALSGTPLTNRPAQLFPILNILDPVLFGNWSKFAWAFCGPKHNGWGWDFSGASNIPELHRLLRKNLMVRRRMEDVMDELPEKMRHVVLLDFEDRKQYAEAEALTSVWLAKTRFGKPFTKEWAKAKAKIGELKKLVGELKLKSVIGWVENFLEEYEGKLILGGIHHSFVEGLYRHFRDRSVLVYGKTPQANRKALFQKFLKDKDCRLLIGNIQVIGVGWSATGVSKVAIAEFPWTPGECVQLEDRTRGLNRGEEGVPSQIYYLAARKSVDERIARMLQTKAQVLSETLDGAPQKDDLDILDKITQELKGGKK